MLFRKKIKEKPKRLPYGRYNTDVNSSVFDGMSFIEQISLIILPCLMVFIFNLFLEMMGISTLWIRLLIAVGIEVLLMTTLWYLITWLTER